MFSYAVYHLESIFHYKLLVEGFFLILCFHKEKRCTSYIPMIKTYTHVHADKHTYLHRHLCMNVLEKK